LIFFIIFCLIEKIKNKLSTTLHIIVLLKNEIYLEVKFTQNPDSTKYKSAFIGLLKPQKCPSIALSQKYFARYLLGKFVFSKKNKKKSLT